MNGKKSNLANRKKMKRVWNIVSMKNSSKAASVNFNGIISLKNSFYASYVDLSLIFIRF